MIITVISGDSRLVRTCSNYLDDKNLHADKLAEGNTPSKVSSTPKTEQTEIRLPLLWRKVEVAHQE